jgi:hypothetical protein
MSAVRRCGSLVGRGVAALVVQPAVDPGKTLRQLLVPEVVRDGVVVAAERDEHGEI